MSIVALNCGIFETIFLINGRRITYLFAIANAATSIFIALSDQFYGNMAVNIYYVTLSIAGFYLWSKVYLSQKSSHSSCEVSTCFICLEKSSTSSIASDHSSLVSGYSLFLPISLPNSFISCHLLHVACFSDSDSLVC
ncbi:nicotinamide mononucleotide transporter [Candidatus Saccharibacteria bacterium]|nr:nicotinamide mononucleotide transporter [Candidatus Saccharibacteria bacterium]